MDYSNGITVFIGNEGFYAEGELRDRAITLPVSGSELQGFLEGNGLVTPMHEETYIADFLDGVPFDHPEIFAHATAEQMNILAQQLKMADPDDLDKVQDWIDAFDTPKNIVELITSSKTPNPSTGSSTSSRPTDSTRKKPTSST